MTGGLFYLAPLVGLVACAAGLTAWSLLHSARDRAAGRRRRRQRIARLEARYETRRRMRPVRDELEGASLHQAADFFPMPSPGRDRARA